MASAFGSFGLAIATRYSLFFIILSFLLQIIANILSAVVGIQAQGSSNYRNAINEINYKWKTRESGYQKAIQQLMDLKHCDGIQSIGSLTTDCDPFIQNLLQPVFRVYFQDGTEYDYIRWSYLLPLIWFIAGSLLIPLVYINWIYLKKKA